VREAIAEGIAIHSVPGPSAALVALCLAGLPTNRFLFAGFLPPKAGERRRALQELQSVLATLIFFEGPQRLSESLHDMKEILGNRDAAICRELTKLHEEVRRGKLNALASEFHGAAPPRGEITIVVGAPLEPAPDLRRMDALLAKALPHMPVNAAADLVALACELPKRTVYERALALKSNEEG
jgi:16S rRNA (cytidine1402-2'-O)-methyltransferase